MLIAAVKPGHDGSIALLDDHRLILNVEQEKDSLPRYAELTGLRLLELMEIADRPPDVLAVGGWLKGSGRKEIGAGYLGVDAITSGVTKLFGHEMRYFSSSHERSHIMMAMGMAPARRRRARRCWCGRDCSARSTSWTTSGGCWRRSTSWHSQGSVTRSCSMSPIRPSPNRVIRASAAVAS